MTTKIKIYLVLFCCLFVSCSEKGGNTSHGATAEAELAQAYLSTVYPVVVSECVACHNDGVYPFAVSIRDQAAEVGVPLMGTDLSSNRFLKKVGNATNPHPNQEIATSAYPKLEVAVNSFFSKVETGVSIGDLIQSEETSLNSLVSSYPSVNNLGFLIFEAEGATISKNTKLEISSGSFQNSFAVSSTSYPSNAVSDSPRVLTYDACSESPSVSVTQAAHIANKSARKYVFRINARLVDASSGKDILIEKRPYTFKAIDILPRNKNYESMTDSDYQNTADPENWSFYFRLSGGQIQHIYDQLISAAGKTASVKNTVNSIVQNESINANNVMSFLQIDSVLRIAGPQTLEPEKTAVHPNEVVALDTSLPDSIIKPGFADFVFTVPTLLSFGDIKEDEDLKFELYTKTNGKLAVSMHEINPITKSVGDIVYPCRVDNVNGATLWRRIGPVTKLKRGRSYRLRMHQVDELAKIDAFLLKVQTEESAGDINEDPTLTRFSGYGRYDQGEQQKIKQIQWQLPVGGFINAELVEHSKFYEISSPVFRQDPASSGYNLQLTGIDFIVNGQLSKTDKSFVEQGVRPPNAIISYGAVFIPIEGGTAKDKISLGFDFLELTKESASLPKYKDAPPIEDIKCLAPEVFYEKVFPIYTQLPVMLREDYDRWSADTNYPYRYDAQKDEVKVPRIESGQYKCVSCHDAEHPFFPMPEDYKEACDEALARSNLDNPYLSFAIRGLRGQFEHPPLYIAADITSGNDLRFVKIPGTDRRVYYGPQTGKLKSYTLSEIEALVTSRMTTEEVSKLYLSLQVPKQFLVDELSDPKPSFTEESSLLPNDLSFQVHDKPNSTFRTNDFVTLYRDDNAKSEIIDQHKVIVDKLVESFVSWLAEEKKRR